MKLALCFIVLFSLLIKSKRKHNYLPFILAIAPLSIFAQNGDIGQGSKEEFIFWLFVLGLLVSILPERKKPFQQQAMRVLKITILGVLVPLICIGQSKAICEGRELPNFKEAVQWNMNDTVNGTSTARCYLPLLDACHFGRYDTEWYFYDNGVLYRYAKLPMLCFSSVPGLEDWERRRFSSSYMSIGSGRWYSVISGVDCGYVYSYEIVGNAFSWQMRKLECN